MPSRVYNLIKMNKPTKLETILACSPIPIVGEIFMKKQVSYSLYSNQKEFEFMKTESCQRLFNEVLRTTHARLMVYSAYIVGSFIPLSFYTMFTK